LVKNDINLVNALKQTKRQRIIDRKKLVVILAGVSVLVVAVAACAFLYNAQITQLDDQIAQSQSYISDSENAQKLSQVADLSAKLQQEVNYNNILEQYNTAFDGIYRLNSNTLKALDRLIEKNSISLQAFSFQDNKISLKCVAPDSVTAADFAKDLEAELLKDVSFTGYSIQSEQEASNYSFTVEGSINE